jgi:hypothetical protein
VCFTFKKGTVKLTVLLHGKEAVVAILEPGQFFGEGCKNGRALRIAITTAIKHGNYESRDDRRPSDFRSDSWCIF